MKCPACGNSMVEIEIQGVPVDVCKNGCGGVWFDNFELKQFDEQHEHVDEDLLNVPYNEQIKVDMTKKRECPKCNDVKLMRRFFSIRREVEIDECGLCGGIFLDRGELSEIRNLFKTESDRKNAADKMFNSMFSETLGKVNEAKISNEKEVESKSRFQKLFGFLSK